VTYEYERFSEFAEADPVKRRDDGKAQGTPEREVLRLLID